MSLALAPLYFAYGKCLFENALKTAEQTLLHSSKEVGTDQESLSDNEESDDSNTNEERKEIDSDDTDDFELAWQTLDTVRVIYQNTEENAIKIGEKRRRLSEVHNLLGDISLENGMNLMLYFAFHLENFTQAIDDFRSAIEYINEHPLDIEGLRFLSSIYFKLSIAYEYNKEFEKSISALDESASILCKCKDFIDTSKSNEIISLLSEIDQKKKELLQERATSNQSIEGKQKDENNSDMIQNIPAKPINDLSNLVRKKQNM